MSFEIEYYPDGNCFFIKVEGYLVLYKTTSNQWYNYEISNWFSSFEEALFALPGDIKQTVIWNLDKIPDFK